MLMILHVFCGFVSKVSWRNVEITSDHDGCFALDSDDFTSLDAAVRIAPSLKEPTRVRAEFPETWLWTGSEHRVQSDTY